MLQCTQGQLITAQESAAQVSFSVVVPVYNEASRISPTLQEIFAFLESRPEPCELVVVDDGSIDGTGELLERICPSLPGVRLVRHSSNHGKGCAVRTGMLQARGEYVLFTDADLSSPVSEVDRLLEPLKQGCCVAVGSRALRPEWVSPQQSRFRRAAGRLFNFWVRRIAGLPFRDTQCGFKAFRREAAQAIFGRQTIDRFGFDVEILYLARKLGYRAIEVPVHWGHSEGTKVRLLQDSLHMLTELLRIRWNDWRGRYDR